MAQLNTSEGPRTGRKRLPAPPAAMARAPCPAGPEIIPVAVTNSPVDTGSAYIFTSTPPPESAGSSGVYWEANLNPLDPGVDTQHIIVAEAYPAGELKHGPLAQPEKLRFWYNIMMLATDPQVVATHC